MEDPAGELTQRQRIAWAAGDYPSMAQTIAGVSEVAISEAGVQAGEELLDVATGTGNAALLAAHAGASVTGIDITPELLAGARERAQEAGVEIRFDEGDAQALPYPDESFDRVVSVFGAMFAPDQDRTAAELLRVARPGATIVTTAWTPSGLNGELLKVLSAHLPPPPPGFRPPTLWGAEEPVKALFAGAADVRCEVRQATGSVRAESPEAWVDHLEQALGPVVLAKAALGPQGSWGRVRAEMVELFDRHNEAGDGSMQAAPDYLLTVVRR